MNPKRRITDPAALALRVLAAALVAAAGLLIGGALIGLCYLLSE